MLDIYSFGQLMISTKDLDPLYVGLKGAKLPEKQLYRWLSAYMMFYHVGLSSWLSEHEGKDFGKVCLEAAKNITTSPTGGRWPRASERRHFRGGKCVTSTDKMFGDNGHPEVWVESLSNCKTEKEVIKEVSKWPMHGAWAGFKMADLLETVLDLPIKFDEDLGIMYEEPRAALDILHKEDPSKTVLEHYQELGLWIRQFETPHPSNRRCGPQELETVCCKWKSYLGNHYFIGKDIKEHRHSLIGWGQTAEKLLEAYPYERESSKRSD